VKRANVDAIFLCPGPFTVLTPSNEAFWRNSDFVDFLREESSHDALQEVLAYHLLPGLFESSMFVEGAWATLQGEMVGVSLNPIKFDQASLVKADDHACNGLIHVIDDVLVPPAFCK